MGTDQKLEALAERLRDLSDDPHDRVSIKVDGNNNTVTTGPTITFNREREATQETGLQTIESAKLAEALRGLRRKNLNTRLGLVFSAPLWSVVIITLVFYDIMSGPPAWLATPLASMIGLGGYFLVIAFLFHRLQRTARIEQMRINKRGQAIDQIELELRSRRKRR